MKVGTCSETLANVLNRADGQAYPEEEHATMTLAGGIMQHGYQCGQLWGASLAAGARVYAEKGAGTDAEATAVVISQRLFDAFRNRYKATDCLELTDTDWKKSSQFVRYMLKGGVFRCFLMAGKYSVIAEKELEAAMEESVPSVAEGPVSCAAVVAKNLGATDRQAVMAAGFAGGIGLSGGGCGALGAAVWMRTLQRSKVNGSKLDYKDPAIQELVERFLKCSDCEFECSTITGKTFKDVPEHAAYIQDGGCQEIIGVLCEDLPEAS